jgi:V/A-type H+/Na+-transporting ATPase subunit D
MGVNTPVFNPPEPPGAYRYSLTQTPPEFDLALEELRKLPEQLFRLAEKEKTLLVLARELEHTRRRANALEHVLIPELQESRNDIEQKISEAERSNISRLMKIKDMLMAKQ